MLETEVKGLRGDVCDIKDGLGGLSEKLDRALANKADLELLREYRDDTTRLIAEYRKEVAELRSFVTKVLIGAGAFAATTLVGIVVFIIYRFIERGIGG